MLRILTAAAVLGLGLAASGPAAADEAVLSSEMNASWCRAGTHELKYLYRRMGEEGQFEAKDFHRGDCDPGYGYIADVIYREFEQTNWLVSFTGWYIHCTCETAPGTRLSKR